MTPASMTKAVVLEGFQEKGWHGAGCALCCLIPPSALTPLPVTVVPLLGWCGQHVWPVCSEEAACVK